MLFPLFQACRSLGWSGCAAGVKYQDADYDIAYKDGITSNDQYFTGSFCPQVTGYHQILVQGKQTFYMNIEINGTNQHWEDKSGRCLPSLVSGQQTFWLMAHRCYKFSARMGYYCAFRESALMISDTPPGGITKYFDTTDTVRCQVNRCEPGYYYDNCTGDCQNTFCNDRGTCNDDFTGDGYCTCNGNYGNPFCEPESNTYFSNGPKISVYRTESFERLNEEKYISGATFNFDKNYYQSIQITGYFYIPQTGYYDFRFISLPDAKVTINGVTLGKLSEDFSCDLNGITYTSPGFGVTRYTRGTKIPFTVSLKTGCAMTSKKITLEYRNFRYHRDSANTPWEQIPDRFIGN